MSNNIHKNNTIKIGIIMGKWVGGGVEAVIMNYYRHIDRSKIQFDFICDSDSTDIPYDEIKKLGGKVILCPPYQKIRRYTKELKRIFKENNYRIVHSNINALSLFPLRAAKKAKVPIRIAHSHSTSNKKEWKKTLIKNVLRPFSRKYANVYFACTEHAGRWLFGNKAFDKGLVTVINNGIDVESYIFDKKVREEKRKELKLKETDLVIGHIGRFMKQKNHEFIIDIFNELHKENKNYKLILIGQGPLQDEIKHKVDELNLVYFLFFLGQKKDANKYYQAMDLFLFPSLYEGLGMVLIEAQCSGLPCIASTEVPKIAKVSDNLEFIDLNESCSYWAKCITSNINKKRIDCSNRILKCGFDIKNEASKLEHLYLKLWHGDNNGKQKN